MPSLILISNEREVYQNGKVTYMPIYFVMFMEADKSQIDEEEYIFWRFSALSVKIVRFFFVISKILRTSDLKV